MKVWKVLLMTAASAILLAGCAATTGSGRRSAANPVQAPEDGSFRITALTTSALPAGKCGMILWTLDANEPTPILRYVVGEGASLAVNGVPIDLTLAETEGAAKFGVAERQVFIGGAGYDADVSVSFGLGFDGGTYLERGLIKVKAANGWEVVAPAAGIAGCRRR